MANIFALHEKGPKDLAEDYRPISLTSVCCKTLEHIVYSNVCKFLDSNNILTPKQHGFRPGFSCETVKHSSFFLSTIGPGPWIPASVVMLPSSISVRPLTLFLIPDFLASCITMVFAAKCLPGFLLFYSTVINELLYMDLSHLGPMWSRVSRRAQCSGHYFSYFILMTLLATFNPTFVCLQTIVSCVVLLHLKMTPVSCKMIYLLYFNGQKLSRWGLILRSAT